MPDNPIKHSDIIQPGNPFNDLIKGLEKTLKLLKETSREYIKFAEKQALLRILKEKIILYLPPLHQKTILK